MNKVLIRESIGRGGIKNIGDFIQSIAQKQFWKGKDNGVIDIERLRYAPQDIPINVIMNGWFMWDATSFPPPDNVNPLFISFHLTPSLEKDFFTNETIEYLKKYEPIGARDYNTMRMMRAHGIDSYFSNCLTLTLDKSYKQETHDGNVVICEPYIDFGKSKKEILYNKTEAVIHWLIHPQKTMRLYRKYSHSFPPHNSIRLFIRGVLEVARFYEVYSKYFSDDILYGADYVTHLVNNYVSIDDKFRLADEFLKKYAKSKLMITSRIHAGLPCLALETPCIFVNEKDLMWSDSVRLGGRFEGIIELFNVITYENGQLLPSNNEISMPVTLNNICNNKESYKHYQNLLKDKVSDFVNQFL